MKLLIAIIHDNDSDAVSGALVAAGFRVTRVASTGGFFRRGSSTFMIGVEEGKVDNAIQLIRENTGLPSEPGARRATLFVLPVESFSQL